MNIYCTHTKSWLHKQKENGAGRRITQGKKRNTNTSVKHKRAERHWQQLDVVSQTKKR